MKYGIIFLLALCFGFFSEMHAQQISSRDNNFSPEEELAGFTVPEGFEVELIASEEDGVVNPIDLTFDDAGRLWTQTARMYPLDPVKDIQWNDLQKLIENSEAQKNDPRFKRIQDLYKGKTKGEDKILMLSNLYGNSKVEVNEWATGLAIPQSILPYKNGAYVAQGSELFYLEDNNKDGKADNRVPLFSGFGFTDSHTMSHTLVRGPGGWIYFIQGGLNKGKVKAVQSNIQLDIDYNKVARYSIGGKQIELVSSGLNNVWGFQLRHNGQWYGTEANDLGYSVVPMEPGTGFPGLGNDRLRTYQPFMPALHDFRVGGTGISGLEFADGGPAASFPKKWNNVALLANPITSTINAVKIVRNPDGSVSAEHLSDFLTSEDKFFRPVNIEFGPDGCLYVADWYNKVISHNELPTTHPDRDKSHGRIWRICYESQKDRTIPNFNTIDTAKLVDHLTSPYLWEKRAAWHQINDRPREETKKLASQLVTLAGDNSQDMIVRIHALWSLEGIGHYNEELVSSLLQSPLGNLRREAVRSLASFSLDPAQVASHLSNNGLVEDKNAMVRSQVLRTLADIDEANQATIAILVQASKPHIPENRMGGGYERSFERYLARKTLEQYPSELQGYMNSVSMSDIPVRNLLWASQSLPKKQKEKVFLKLWPQADIQTLNEPLFVSIAVMLQNSEVYEMVKPIFQEEEQAQSYLTYAIEHQSQIQTPELARLLQNPANRLLQSDDKSDINLALDAIDRVGIEGLSEDIAALFEQNITDETIKYALNALQVSSKENEKIFAGILDNEELNFDLRVTALNMLVDINLQEGLKATRNLLESLNAPQKNVLTSILSKSDQGSDLLMRLYDNREIGINSFDITTAERIRSTNSSDSRSLAILQGAKKTEKQQKSAEEKVAEYITIVKNREGNVNKGKQLFQTCLLCHAVENRGQDIAPALDGSAHRDIEALFTALVDPNAAVEAGYQLYRVKQKGGEITEGYMVKRDDNGTTIAFMGGATVFIKKEEIESQGYISSRSFMPEELIENYSDQEIADLVSYIGTLK